MGGVKPALPNKGERMALLRLRDKTNPTQSVFIDPKEIVTIEPWVGGSLVTTKGNRTVAVAETPDQIQNSIPTDEGLNPKGPKYL